MESKMHLHNFENNRDSQSNLEENQQKFSNQCLLVMKLLNQGVRLTVANAIGYGINSLPRRIMDCRERNGITNIKDKWVTDADGKRLYKEWFIEIPKLPTKKEVISNHQPLIQLSLL